MTEKKFGVGRDAADAPAPPLRTLDALTHKAYESVRQRFTANDDLAFDHLWLVMAELAKSSRGADAPAPAPPQEPPPHVVELAIEVSACSPCQSKRGAVLFKGDYVVSHGFNYKPRAFACDGSDTCKATCRSEAVHAEQQALLSADHPHGADLLHVKTIDGKLVPSGGPSCVECSKLALAAGIAGVWLFHAVDGWLRYDIEDFHRLSLGAAPAPRTPPQEKGRSETLQRIAAGLERVLFLSGGECRHDKVERRRIILDALRMAVDWTSYEEKP